MIRIHNLETQEIIDREMTDDEVAQFQAEQAAQDKLNGELAAEAEAKAAQRQAILDRLGLTADEAKLLLG